MLARVSEILGKEVYTVNGTRIGRVLTLTLNVETKRIAEIYISGLDSKAAKKYNLEGRRGIIVPYRGVRAIDDIVIINEIKPVEIEGEEEREGYESFENEEKGFEEIERIRRRVSVE